MDKINVAYAVPDLTHLRYFAPLAVTLEREAVRKGVTLRQCFFCIRTSTKYNGLGHAGNYDKLCALAADLPVTLCSGDVSAETLVTVEHCDAGVRCARRVSLAHGYDSVLQHASWLSDPRYGYTYVCGRVLYDDERLSAVKKVMHPFPPSLLLMDEHAEYSRQRYVGDRRVATLFYPDMGLNAVADELVDALVSRGLDVVVKQRRKHQHITTSLGRHCYDDTWYPSEAVCLPLISDIIIGFGSTAYLDLVEAGLRYVNIDIQCAAYPWSVMRHPTAENYLRVVKNDIDHIVESVVSHTRSGQKLAGQPVGVGSEWWRIIVDARDGDSSNGVDETTE